MPARRKTSAKGKAFAEAGALVAGGVAGGLVSWLILGDIWFWNLAVAALGAWLAYAVVERFQRKRPRRK